MENVLIDHNLQKNPPTASFCPSGLADSGLSSIPRNDPSGDMDGVMPVLTKNPGYATAKETEPYHSALSKSRLT